MTNLLQVIEIFDRNHIRHNRNRAAATFEKHGFLFEWVTRVLYDRLQDVRRQFPTALQIGTRGKTGSAFLKNAGIENLVLMDIAENMLPKGLVVQGDEEYLPFAQNTFDLIFSPLSLHTVNDLPGTLIQINRALKPDGLCIAALFGGETLYELRQALMQAELKIKGGTSPHIAPFADKQQIGALMQRARFSLPVVDSEIVTVTYDNIFKLMRDLRYMGEGNALNGHKAALNRSILLETEKIYRETFTDKDDRITASFEIIFLIGWAPHNSQQKPLRPGSAEHRLSDVLQTTETTV